jgi:hypothetical protein
MHGIQLYTNPPKGIAAEKLVGIVRAYLKQEDSDE